MKISLTYILTRLPAAMPTIHFMKWQGLRRITAWNCSAPLITARPFREAAMKCTFVILNPFQRSCLE